MPLEGGGFLGGRGGGRAWGLSGWVVLAYSVGGAVGVCAVHALGYGGPGGGS